MHRTTRHLSFGRRKRVKGRHAERLEIANIAGHHGQIVHYGRCRDHRVLKQIVRATVHQARPASKHARIHRQNIVAFRNLFEPGFDLGCLGGILFARDFDPGLQFADSNRGQMEICISYVPQPSQDSAVRTRTPQLRYDVGIEKETRVTSLKQCACTPMTLPT